MIIPAAASCTAGGTVSSFIIAKILSSAVGERSRARSISSRFFRERPPAFGDRPPGSHRPLGPRRGLRPECANSGHVWTALQVGLRPIWSPIQSGITLGSRRSASLRAPRAVSCPAAIENRSGKAREGLLRCRAGHRSNPAPRRQRQIPHAPRLDPSRSALAKLDAAPKLT
jgi:hypothetical protein